MNKLTRLIFLTMLMAYHTNISFGEEYIWKKVVNRSWLASKILKTTVRLPKAEEETLRKKIDYAFECPIASEEFDELPINSVIAMTPCNHFFYKQSLLEWIEWTKQKSRENISLNKEPIPVTCPICQQHLHGDVEGLTFYKKKKLKH
ncbi:MAG: hypothetical protein HRU09_07500 [Oligoflexales bacterium]|nr:hypothetical protein [Oligoflexales bacterium]